MSKKYFTKDYGSQSIEKDSPPNVWTEEQLDTLSEAELFGLYACVSLDEWDDNPGAENYAKLLDDFIRLQANGELIQHLGRQLINH